MINLLLVDDDQDDIYFFKQAVKKVALPINLSTYRDGKEICDYLAVNKDCENSIVLLDLNMPGIGGLETLRIIRQSLGLITLPVLIYTTSKNVKDIEESYKIGASSYIKKLDTINEIAAFLKSVVGFWAIYNRAINT
ncbi:response regulator [Psychrosphaera sp. 1_MG-2023]|uniref:response regulator n=1 Tax=Psychrosphaera sp. 1_MG-2023 TaxID=3062643 RepID=UPI0026E45957|nr:response regulator [Psychrosphaera sp. 1_MG-2023]MDO6720728.1 response regulator [Psychrosphaera sp. 1_MG-2023]